MKSIIEIEKLGKLYNRGAQREKYRSIRDTLFHTFQLPRQEKFWALQDINVSVRAGESLAIIGRNGAGKSTLLKILSRITPPTIGSITLKGRLASLLEVGTGFHPELTGRENIYLNGSILGLRREDIKQKLDAIVDFSGVEAFLETPLKQYSSGMQLRLAFSVAAHLEPEILVIDEVLAVGDTAFQQKCIEKMTSISHEGRTLLFVSHNLAAIRNLCKTGIVLEHGKLNYCGTVENAIEFYTARLGNHKGRIDLTTSQNRKVKPGHITFANCELNKNDFNANDSLRISIQLQSKQKRESTELLFGVNIQNEYGQCIIHLSNLFIDKIISYKEGCEYIFSIPRLSLKQGAYHINLFLRADEEIVDWIENAISFQVLPSNIYGFANSQMITGLLQPQFEFYVE